MITRRRPPCSQTKSRPSGANCMAVGLASPLAINFSEKPDGSVAPWAGRPWKTMLTSRTADKKRRFIIGRLLQCAEVDRPGDSVEGLPRMERADGRIRGGAGLARPRAPARSSVRTTAAENGYVSAGPPASAAASPALSGRQLVCSRCDKRLRGRRLPELDLPTADHACAVQHRAHAVLHRVPWSALARGGASQVLLRFGRWWRPGPTAIVLHWASC